MAYVQRWRDRAAPLRHGSMIALLVLFVMMVFVVPFVTASTSVAGRILQDVLLSLILLNGLITATDRSGEFALISLAALVALVVVWAGWLLPTVLTLAIRDEATLLALVLLGMVVGMRVFGPGAVTRDRIAGAVALYILVGVVWADAYYLVSLYVPGAFAGATHSEIPENHSIWIYFSFVTLTTVGYGDITPVAPAARSLSNLEALIGQLYPAIVLARLVSLQVAGGGSGTNKS
ncbi:MULTISPECIES: potassium channel family protein [Paraburkholderia]|uniref:Two pore domain potassium channel family protein n=1 Tax=Paraburkholderia podalyriae TaxID=1938811 RepID=A0ABR7Q2U4_9BURK|nr:potassium channel family protein [Paraburkholderia podalyriae]MBC8752768.1 two pore domain potassium channel family protein [Paraburkholderia podalyriae]